MAPSDVQKRFERAADGLVYGCIPRYLLPCPGANAPREGTPQEVEKILKAVRFACCIGSAKAVMFLM